MSQVPIITVAGWLNRQSSPSTGNGFWAKHKVEIITGCSLMGASLGCAVLAGVVAAVVGNPFVLIGLIAVAATLMVSGTLITTCGLPRVSFNSKRRKFIPRPQPVLARIEDTERFLKYQESLRTSQPSKPQSSDPMPSQKPSSK